LHSILDQKDNEEVNEVLLQSLIDVDKWNAAKWRATAFLHDPTGADPPCMGIVFENINMGDEIFSEWLERLGKVDEFEELRIAIVEGVILGEEAGYSVHVSSDPWHTQTRAHALGLKYEFDTAVIISRINRMTPEPQSPHLRRFKKEIQKHKRYSLIPVSSSVEPHFDLSIEKTEIYIRQASEINKNDRDAAVFPVGYFDRDKTVH
jgi:hypothetical protein